MTAERILLGKSLAKHSHEKARKWENNIKVGYEDRCNWSRNVSTAELCS
jgi:hypothetical protein